MEENELNQQMALDDLVYLPMEVTEDPRLRRIHMYAMLKQMDEVSHLSVPHSAYQLIERMNMFYILQRERERDGRVFAGSPADKALVTAWIDTVKEFNKLIAIADIERHRQLLNTITQIIMHTLKNEITDPELRTSVSLRIAAAIEQAGVA